MGTDSIRAALRRERRARAARLLERISLSWGLCLASEWLVDPTLALACAEALRSDRPRPVAKPSPRPRTFWTPLARRALRFLGATGLCLAACAPVPPNAASHGPIVLVMNAGDHTVSALDARGRPVHAPIAVGGPHTEVVTTAGGAALTYGPAAGAGLGYLSSSGGRWQSRPLSAGGTGDIIEHAASLPGVAALVHVAATLTAPGPRGAPSCRLTVLHLPSGTTARSLPLCTAGEIPTGLVVQDSSEGRLAYVALSNRQPREPGAARGRLLAIDLDSGLVRRSLTSNGALTSLTLAPPAFELGPRLYAVQATEDTEAADIDPNDDWSSRPGSYVWRLLRFTPESLTAELDVPLSQRLVEITPSGDGRRIYGRHPGVTYTWLIHVDLTTGRERRLAQVPGLSRGPVVLGDTLYVADHDRGAVWTLDRHTGALKNSVPVGRLPTSAALVR